MQPFSLYLHIPFCTHRCGYCDFNTYAGLESLISPYVAALCAEIRFLAESAGVKLPVHTIFFGGGTPSLLPARELEKILISLQDSFSCLPNREISLEANPGTLSPAYLADLHSLGVNRLSLGVQSAHPGELRLLERTHDYPAVIESVAWARRAGFRNLNLDLIYGLPEQRKDVWQHTLELAAGLRPDHFSLYALSLEHGTPFAHWAGRGLLSTPDPDVAAEMYEYASEYLTDNGYAQYEISNWARTSPVDLETPTAAPAFACRHNLQYWRNLPYLGLGAGAHGYAPALTADAGTRASSFRTANVLSPSTYIEHMKTGKPLPFPRTPATQNFLPVDLPDEIGETMMMGLRLTRLGVSDSDFQLRFGRSLHDVFARQIDRFTSLGLLEFVIYPAGGILRLTPHGRLLGNQVFSEFI
jgi:oxygen-independent coproporphyrinogen-3 oxidase